MALIDRRLNLSDFAGLGGGHGGHGGIDYVLADQYVPSDFFSGWSFYDQRDPTKGFVDYVDYNTAQSAGLIREEEDSVYIGVDYATPNPPEGRQSVRITSDREYDVASGALIVVDVEHMPGTACGPWPAVWLLGTGGGSKPWPYG